MARTVRTWPAALLVLALLGGCGEEDEPEPAGSGGSIDLTIRYDDGSGKVTTGRLICSSSEQRAAGSLAGRAPAARQCSHARDVVALLTEPPPGRRSCAEVFGGSEEARITGTIDGRRVNRLFRRTNGCEIADFTRVSGALSITG